LRTGVWENAGIFEVRREFPHASPQGKSCPSHLPGQISSSDMAASLPILTFHSLDDRPSVISFPPRLFERGMAGLHQRRYRSLIIPSRSRRTPATGPLVSETFLQHHIRRRISIRLRPCLSRLAALWFLGDGFSHRGRWLISAFLTIRKMAVRPRS
jgi:hypothetical protein